jgi:hypothetical protein
LTGQGSADSSAIESLSRQIVTADYAKRSGSDTLLDVDAYGEKLVDFWKSGDFGTAVHRDLEYLTNIKSALKNWGAVPGDLANIHSMAEMQAFLTDPNGYVGYEIDGKTGQFKP